MKEKEIEQYLYENPGAVIFAESPTFNDSVDYWLYRQLEVPSGIIDLVGVTDSCHLVIVELKRDEIDARAIAQVCRYASDIQKIVDAKTGNRPLVEVKKVVIGKSIDKKALFEAQASNVMCALFDNKLSITPVHFSNEFESLVYRMLGQLAEDDRLIQTITELQGYHREEYESMAEQVEKIIRSTDVEMQVADLLEGFNF